MAPEVRELALEHRDPALVAIGSHLRVIVRTGQLVFEGGNSGDGGVVIVAIRQ